MTERRQISLKRPLGGAPTLSPNLLMRKTKPMVIGRKTIVQSSFRMMQKPPLAASHSNLPKRDLKRTIDVTFSNLVSPNKRQ